MSIESILERQAVALECIAEILGQLDFSVPSPQGETVAEPMVETVTEEPVPEVAQVVDLTANQAAPAQPQAVPANDTEVMQPAAGVTKRTLWETLQETYNALAPLNRGPEIGELLAQYQAMHIDQLNPSDYMAVHQGLVALRESVGGTHG